MLQYWWQVCCIRPYLLNSNQNDFYKTRMRLLIIEDEENIASFLQKGLKSFSYSVDTAGTKEEAIALVLKNNYDMVVLDYYLPDANGEEIAKSIREKKKDLAIIALSNESKVEIKIAMLSVCDDYMIKPFSLEELVARIEAVKRREPKVFDQIIGVDGLSMCMKTYTATCEGKTMRLSNKEFALLKYLIENKGRVLSRNLILEKVWDTNADPFTNTVDVHIQRLRVKIGSRGKEFVVTVPGIGYKLSDGA